MHAMYKCIPCPIYGFCLAFCKQTHNVLVLLFSIDDQITQYNQIVSYLNQMSSLIFYENKIFQAIYC